MTAFPKSILTILTMTTLSTIYIKLCVISEYNHSIMTKISYLCME